MCSDISSAEDPPADSFASIVPSNICLLGPAEIRSLATSIDITPTKNWGQNFVIDPGTVRKIVSISQINSGDKVLEIGPGLGSLTLALLQAEAALTVVEIDSRLTKLLPITLSKYAPGVQVTIINKDALDLTVADIPVTPNFLVANLPYNVSVPVLLHILSLFPQIQRVVVMVQKEVAQRLAAEPGSRVYGVPSVKVRFFGKVRMEKTVNRTVFWPKPHIDSAVVSIECYKQAPWPTSEIFRHKLFAVIDAAFSTRRKTLRQSLIAWAGSVHAAEEKLVAANIDPQRRAETLSITDFIALVS